jgi:hypothetical protein
MMMVGESGVEEETTNIVGTNPKRTLIAIRVLSTAKKHQQQQGRSSGSSEEEENDENPTG